MSEDEASCTRAQHIHIASRNDDDDINYGDEVDEVDNEASYIAPQDGDDVNNYGNEVDEVDDKASYITSPDGRRQ